MEKVMINFTAAIKVVYIIAMFMYTVRLRIFVRMQFKYVIFHRFIKLHFLSNFFYYLRGLL